MAKNVACATLLLWQSLFYPNISEALIGRKKGESTSSTHPFSHKEALYDDDLEKYSFYLSLPTSQSNEDARLAMRQRKVPREDLYM